MTERRSTSTSNFGVGKRESHDASGFYGRFRAPELSSDDTVLAPTPVAEPFVLGDARHMDAVADGSVALVVTSPPYFAGKQYEEELQKEGVPGSYLEYLDLLTEVFRECVRKLEPGGRIAVNVANLGRKPYRSLAADVIRILEHDLGLLLRGELIWQKAEGASGSCAWGSFRSASNPVLRDITERVIVASKGRFDRARPVKKRAAEGLPHQSTLMTEDFMALTLDVWSIPPESARRVGHPAPFPVELPEQLIRLYTYTDDLVLDPFMGSGSALMAAALLGRRYVGYDLDANYVDLARTRVNTAVAAAIAPITAPRLSADAATEDPVGTVGTVGTSGTAADRAHAEGLASSKLAERALTNAGFAVKERNRRIPKTGVRVDFVATDGPGDEWRFLVCGPFTTHRAGLQRTDVAWRAIGQAIALRGRAGTPTPVVLLTSDLPRRASDADTALRAAGPAAFFDVIGLVTDDDLVRLARYAAGGRRNEPGAGFWTSADLRRR